MKRERTRNRPLLCQSCVCVGLCLFLAVQAVHGQDDVTEIPPTPQAGGDTVMDNGDTQQRPIDAAMDPLYLMTNTFLNIIQPESKGFILSNVQVNLAEDIKSGNFESVLHSMGTWEPWAQHYVGFLICAILGILFIILMPIVGFCFCCCRCCCGNCGGKASTEEHKRDRCKRNTCGVLLAIVATLMLAGMVCAFVTNELLREQSSDADNSLLGGLSTEINSLDQFKNNAVREFKTTILTDLRSTADDVITTLNNAPVEARGNLSSITRSEELLGSATGLAQAAIRINTSLTEINSKSNQLIQTGRTLQTEIENAKTEIIGLLDSCGQPQCQQIKQDSVESLSRDADFTRVDNVTKELGEVRNVLEQNLDGLIKDGESNFKDIADKIENETADEIEGSIQNVTTEIDTSIEAIEGELDDTTDDIEKIRLNDTVQALEEWKELMELYGNYRYYGGIALSCLLLLVVLFYYLGLCFGACGELPSEDAAACNKGVGASILMAGIAFAFIFGWILMIVCLILFLSGGLTYTELCRYMSNINQAPQPIRDIIDEQFQMVLDRQGMSEWDVKLTEILSDCENNKALFEAFNLQSFVNLSQVLNLQQYDIEPKIKQLVDAANIDLSGVTIFSPATRQELSNLEQAGLGSIDVQSFKTELSRSMTSVDLTTLANDLEGAATQLPRSQATLANDLRREAADLRNIQTSTVAAMVDDAQRLSDALTLFEAEVVGPPAIENRIRTLMTNLEQAQESIQRDGTVLVKAFIEDLGDRVWHRLETFVSSLKNKIRTQIGRCEPVYQAVDNSVDDVCVAFLNPWNGFWFSFGWCLFFSIPSIIIAASLITLYRKTDEYFDDKSFDDANRSRMY